MEHPTAGCMFANRFEIDRLAGSGGMGSIYRARDHYSGDLVALKLLHLGSVSPQDEERFAREAQLLSELSHPGIVSYVAHGKTVDGSRFLAMEWLDGEDLGQRLLRGPMPFHDCSTLIKGIAEALAVAHECGIVHRDLKPTNLFLPDGDITRVKILDFGIARRMTEAMTKTGAVIGTPEYMAPEQVRGARDLTPAADVFSLGCVLYECLTGKPPFIADHIAAVLVRILFEDPAPVETQRLGVSEFLLDLLEKMLQKDPASRFPDASSLCAAISTLDALDDLSELALATTAEVPQIRQALFAESEQGLLSVILAAPSEEGADKATLQPANPGEDLDPEQRQSLLDGLQEFGGSGIFLAGGALLVTMPQLENARDQVARTAQAAMLIKARWEGAAVSIATGCGSISKRMAVGEVVERAARALRSVQKSESSTLSTSGIFADELSAQLLEGRFVQTPRPNGTLVLSEEREPDPQRPLLGKPTPFVGRETEIGILESQLNTCIEESEARAVLITAVAGLGKSRLRYEFQRRAEKRHTPLTVLLGVGDIGTAGAPYCLIGQVVRRHCGVRGGDSLDIQRAEVAARTANLTSKADQLQVKYFLGELCSVPFPDQGDQQLRAARNDPHIMHEQIRRAFVDWLRVECAQRPVLILLDDLQWGDSLSIGLMDAALHALRNERLFVLALARPEVRKTFPKLWASHQLQELSLQNLRRRACERLVQQVLGTQLAPDIVNHIVEQSTGNALFLEELIRSAGKGGAEGQANTVVAMLQSRISQFDLVTRRVVQAASVFGLTFWRGGILDMLLSAQPSHAANEIDRCLQVLVEAEIVEPHTDSRFRQEQQYSFRHALVREAAYALLTPEDLTNGHRLAGKYLERMGELEPLVLAEHYRRGGEQERSVTLYTRAGDAAERMWALPEARMYYAAAFALLDPHAHGVKLRRGKADLLLRQVRLGILAEPFEQNLARLSEARKLVASLRDSGQAHAEDDRLRMQVDLLSGKFYFYQGQYEKAIEYYEPVCRTAEAKGDLHSLAILAQAMGAARAAQGHAGVSVGWLSRAIALQEFLETDYDRLRSVSTYACSLVLAGRYQEGMALHEKALAQATAGRRPTGLGLAQMNRTISLRWCGDFSAMLESAQAALALVQKSGEHLWVPSALKSIAWAYSFRNQPQEALVYQSQAKEIERDGGKQNVFYDWFIAGDAEIALRAGDSEAAIALTAQAVPFFRKEGRLLALGLAEQVWGLAIGYRNLSQSEEADSHLSAALHVMETSEQRLGAAILRLEWAQLVDCRGDEILSAALRKQAIAQFESSGCSHLIEGVERATAWARIEAR